MKWIASNSIQWKQDPDVRDAFEVSKSTRVFFHVFHTFANNYDTWIIETEGGNRSAQYFHYAPGCVELSFLTSYICFLKKNVPNSRFKFILMAAIGFKDEQNKI